jgi:hypothetical protein
MTTYSGMCPLCGALLTEHWSDPDGPGARRGRTLRTGMVRRVLAGFGVTLTDWGGTAYVLHDGKGRSEVVHDLTTLWTEAERLAGRPLDPLDPALVAALHRDG